MSNTISLMTSTITSDALWATVGEIMPVALITTMFALGFYLVRKQMKKVSRAKGGI